MVFGVKLWSLPAVLCCVVTFAAAQAQPAAELARLRSLQQSGKLPDARSSYESLLRLPSLDDATRGAALLELARIDLASGRYQDSIRQAESSAALFRKLQDQTNVAAAINTSGVARLYSGDYAGALRDQEAALNIARRTNDQANQVTRLNNIGNVYYFQGRYSSALDRYSEAMQIVVQAGAQPWVAARRQLTTANLATVYQRLGLYDRALESYRQMRESGEALRPSEQAQVFANMGALYRRLGDPVKALEQYRAAQALYQQSHFRSGEIAVLNNIGIAQVLDLSALAEGLKTFNQSVTLATESQDRPLLLHSTLYRGETLARMGEWDRARIEFAAALQLAESLGSAEEKWKALFGLARFQSHEGKLADSQKLLREAIAVIESLRSEIGSAVSARGFLTDKRQVFDELIGQLIRAPNVNTAELFTLFEQSRSRGVRQRAHGDVHVPSLAHVQGALRPEQVMVEYWLGRDGSAASITITSATAELRRLKTSSELKADIGRLAALLARPEGDSWQALAASVREQLLPASANHNQHWIIVADRELSLLPFEVLLGPDVEVSYLPAAGFLMNSEHNGRGVKPPWFSSFLAFADPRPAAAGNDVGSTLNLGPLTRAEDEVESAGRSLGGSTEIHTGPDALKKWFRVAPVVHLATHGRAVLEDPARSWLLFAPSAGTTQRFESLFLPEVEKMNLRGVDLLTASACETDSGAIQEGEGPRSFSRAFLGSGVRTVVSSLWRVEDA
ncbi:MAG TPA: CHAT domain-containing protein, partial [Bryobacteraceae bacterium]|nr:CHAT domain-containing protein [Bryobacteraceae bacterium]